MGNIQVGILMGSDSDLPVMQRAASVLREFGIEYFMTVASAHRTPDRVIELAKRAENEGWKILIAGAGMAAHLAGFIAAHTVLPVIGVPMDSSPLGGLDALLSTVQMPGGVPVATMGLGSAGAKNAGLFAVEILALQDPELKQKLKDYREEQRKLIEEKAAALSQQ
ncbi:5-(carboxyamino)imidazole ribonucleotide mutase [Desulfomonile tiedjei]|uniref:N5-carboxyaminoimidazole ribonucleotide mutase n=1 Tax=Desulfomonile tiedjei (strain ATCC 49306 / DSM 6799 / DCB-1) TaxID=706587 RepID=I4C2Q3_DESTA|nr:5-(carboxyamino)imidazole ribonucleotide mutase [Desulfomonile tiedjei]AFM23844.1 5-(carboxyamino)imidazole ribonucleotide mutase [Desulfomonile tiedjei DSM 6799]